MRARELQHLYEAVTAIARFMLAVWSIVLRGELLPAASPADQPPRQGTTAKVPGRIESQCRAEGHEVSQMTGHLVSAILLPNRRRISSPNPRKPLLSGSMAQLVPR